MSSSRAPFIGRFSAAGFLIEPAHVGEAEAFRRVAVTWVEGSRLFELRGRLLLVLPEPVSVRAELAPGLPVVATADGVRLHADGAVCDVALADLVTVDLSRVVDVAHLEVEELRPAPPVPTEPPVLRETPTSRTRPFRDEAGVGPKDSRLARRVEKLGADREDARGDGPLRRLWARSPAGAVLRRRHARYLDDLTETFRSGDWNEALRSAISLGGEGSAALTSRLPRRRSSIQGPTPRRSASGATVGYGPSIHQHLREVYTQAAARLEREGKYLLAAFVHADLLEEPLAAVHLLERHRDFRRAAELAEGRELDPGLAVRLWWRAGERDRALRVARARGAFASALSLAGDLVEDDVLTDLRREWVRDRRSAGDHLGVTLAAWPSPALRDETVPDMVAGVAAGGASAGPLLARLLHHAPSDAALDTARAALAGGNRHVLDAFVPELARLPVGDPAADRELASSALLSVLDGTVRTTSGAGREVFVALRKRADRVLAADLPPFPAPSGSATPLQVDARAAGTAVIHDAIAVGPGSILVALGQLGVRLVDHAGRVRARWSIPVHRIVVADHGGRVLLVTDRGATFGLHRLDLPVGRPVELPPLDVPPLESYDGARPVLLSVRGLEWIEPLADRWQVVWRELSEPAQRVVQVARTATQMSALVHDDGLHAWHWSLPQLRLQSRGAIEAGEPDSQLAVVASGQFGRLHQVPGVAALAWHATHGQRLTTADHHPEGRVQLMVSGTAFATADGRAGSTVLTVHRSHQSPALAEVVLPDQAEPLLRSWGQLLTVGHRAGRLLVLDSEHRTVVADVRVTV